MKRFVFIFSLTCWGFACRAETRCLTEAVQIDSLEFRQTEALAQMTARPEAVNEGTSELSPTVSGRAPLLTELLNELQSGITGALDLFDLTAAIRRDYLLWGGGDRTTEERLHRQVLNRTGSLRPMTCLEIELLENHLRFRQNPRNPGEFAASVLRPPTPGDPWRIYFDSRETSEASTSAFTLAIENDLRAGYQYAIFIHNHPFYFVGPEPSPSVSLGGSVVPSPADVEVFADQFRKYGLERAVIVNGTTALDLTEADNQRLQSAVPQR